MMFTRREIQKPHCPHVYVPEVFDAGSERMTTLLQCADRFTLEDPQLSMSRASSASRSRPSSAGRYRPQSAGRAQPRPAPFARPHSAGHSRSYGSEYGHGRQSTSVTNNKKKGSWPRAARSTLTKPDGSTSQDRKTSDPRSIGKALNLIPRSRTGDQRWQWEQWSGTTVIDEAADRPGIPHFRNEEATAHATVPKPVLAAIQEQVKKAVKSGHRFVCIFETCHNCEDHALTTRHCPGSYEAYRDEASKWIRSEFSFIKCEVLETNFVAARGPVRRIGAFEVYFFCPSRNDAGTKGSKLQNFLLHSKLCTKRWPLIEALLARLRTVVPKVVLRAQALLSSERLLMYAKLIEAVPETIHINGATGSSANAINGRYDLQETGYSGKPCWSKAGEDKWLLWWPNGWHITDTEGKVSGGLVEGNRTRGWLWSDDAGEASLPTVVREWKVWQEEAGDDDAEADPIGSWEPQSVAVLKEWSQAEMESTLDEAKSWGLGSWEVIHDLSEQVRELRVCRAEGERARAAGNSVALRECLRMGSSLNLDSETMADWRGKLRSSNMVLFNIRSIARKFQRNTQLVLAVRLLETSQVPPLKPTVLLEAVAKGREVGIAEEDLEIVIDLHARVAEVLSSVKSALKERNLEALSKNIERGVQLQVKHEELDAGQRELSNTASQLQRSIESKDLVELTNGLAGWKLPSKSVVQALARSTQATSNADVAVFSSADDERVRLQRHVDDAERYFENARWDKLQIVCRDELMEVHVDDEQWNKWMAALERERNFKLLKAMSGVGFEFKRRVHAHRLETAMNAKSIPKEQLKEVADAAERHHVDKLLVERARSEVSTARSRLEGAASAAKKQLVDTADAQFFKLRSGRVRMDEDVKNCSEPLYEMAHAVMAADAIGDWEAMQEAITGWKEEKPGADHPAFKEKDSPTASFRYACNRIKELRLIKQREKLGSMVEILSKDYGAKSANMGKLLVEIVEVVRDLLELGWDMTVARKAGLLQLAEIIKAQQTGMDATRFGAMLFRTCGNEQSSARVVFLVDQDRIVGQEFNRHVAPALTMIAEGIGKHANGVHLGALGYNPVKSIQDLTQSMSMFKENVTRFVSSKDGKQAPVDRALQKAYGMLKDKDSTRSDRDSLRIVFNFAFSELRNAKEAHKVFVQLEQKGVIIVNVAVGALPDEDVLQEFCSPGLVFKVEKADQLSDFVRDAFESMARVMDTAKRYSAKEVVDELERLQSDCE